MDLAKYAVTAVVVEGRSVRAVAASTGRSKSWVAPHVQLYRDGGDAALEPKRRGPVTAKNRTSASLEDAIVAMRKDLVEHGWDAGARRVRHDHVDRWGAVTLRYRHRLHHIGVGRPQRGKRVIILMADLDVRVIDEDGVLLRHFELDTSVDYQAKSRDIV